MNFLIRDYEPTDYNSLIDLWKATGLWSEERDDHSSSIENCNNCGGRLLIMTETGTDRMIGSSWMTLDGRRMYLHHFGIHPEFQRLGLGKKLAIESLGWIKQMGYQVKLEVHKSNLPAKKLYEGLGFFLFRDYEIYMIRDLQKI